MERASPNCAIGLFTVSKCFSELMQGKEEFRLSPTGGVNCTKGAGRPSPLLPVQPLEPLAIDLLEDVAADLDRRSQLLVLDRERRVGEDEATDLLDHRELGIDPVDRGGKRAQESRIFAGVD